MAKSAKVQIPSPFLVTIVPNRKGEKASSQAWAVKQGDRWRFADALCIQVNTLTVIDPKNGHCLSGVGVVRSLKRGEIVITA